MRKTDQNNKTHVRRERRVVHEQWQWFYRTREGNRGPFDTRQAAVVNLNSYVDTMSFIENNPDSVPESLDLDDVTLIELKSSQY